MRHCNSVRNQLCYIFISLTRRSVEIYKCDLKITLTKSNNNDQFKNQNQIFIILAVIRRSVQRRQGPSSPLSEWATHEETLQRWQAVDDTMIFENWIKLFGPETILAYLAIDHFGDLTINAIIAVTQQRCSNSYVRNTTIKTIKRFVQRNLRQCNEQRVWRRLGLKSELSCHKNMLDSSFVEIHIVHIKTYSFIHIFYARRVIRGL